MTHRISHRPAIEVQGQENASSSRQATLNVTLGMPQSAAGPNEGMSQVTAPPEAVQSTVRLLFFHSSLIINIYQ